MRLIRELKRGMGQLYWRYMPPVRRRAAGVPLLRKIYFGGRHVAWRVECTVHLLAGMFRSSSNEREAVQASGLFDEEWYAQRYAPALVGVQDLLGHFFSKGARQGFWPNPLFDPVWYQESCADVARLKVNPLVHYLFYGASEGRRPVPLFDSAFYLAAYPDVAANGVNPLMHYLGFGASEMRDPHPLFSSHWYLATYRDVAMAGLNPLVHFIECGAYEGRDPNPYFHSGWYLTNYPDVAAERLNPLQHYAYTGYLEGRQPGPAFDAKRYLADHPDVAQAGMDPLYHYLRIGRAEARAQPLRLATIADALPSAAARRVPRTGRRTVDVIIPVYRGIAETSACIESYYASSSQVPARLIVINDCSPDPEMREYLKVAAAKFGFLLLTNEQNMGFVRTANRGMALNPENDVLLLNSDTEVAGDWLDRIVAHADADPRVATVTPMSNNATICSYPEFAGRRTLPQGMTVDDMDRACTVANAGRSVTVPSGVGFCMLIKRECLNRIGLFDEAAFGKGYGEENDLCMRAIAAGWRNILALDTFVFHAGEVSFAGDASAGKSAGAVALLRKHPRYNLEVGAHVAEDPGKVHRLAITAQVWRAQCARVMLLVTHSLGGGTERHVQEIARRYAATHNVLILRPAGVLATSGISLEASDAYGSLTVNFAFADGEELATLLAAFPVSNVHVHHLFGFGAELQRALSVLDVPFDFTVHDYFTVCPQINLSVDGESYCGEPAEAGCNACIRQNQNIGVGDIRSWRLRHEWVLRDARRVVAPSVDVGQRIQRYAPDANVAVVQHEEVSDSWSEARRARRLEPGDVLRVGVVGVLAKHKGRELVIGAAMDAAEQALPIEYIVIGDPFGELPPPSVAAIRTTGRYNEQELPDILAREQPDILLFASRWPETYSYTLTAALDASLPVLVPDIGAFAQRVSGRPWSYVFPAGIDAAGLNAHIGELRARDFEAQDEHGPGAGYVASSLAMVGPDAGYSLAALEAPRPASTYARDRLNVVVVMEQDREIPSPCAHIRLITFFDDLQARGGIDVRYVDVADVARYRADVLVTHRAAVSTLENAQRLTLHARENAIPLVYDLDDNLAALDPAAENGKYRPMLAVVHHLLEAADVIWASTPELGSVMASHGGRNIEVLRNALDPVLWADAFARPIRTTGDAPVRILYMGTRTHGEDFQLIEPALRTLKQRHGRKISLNLVGVREESDSEDWFTAVPIPAVVGGSYPAFVSWMGSVEAFDIGITPLCDTDFNRSKSEIKVLDYAALGVVPVASRVESYRSTITPENGRLVGPETAEWVAVLDELIGDPVLRHRLAAQARSHDFVGAFRAGADQRLASLRAAVTAGAAAHD